MNLFQLAYLITILVFIGIPFVILWRKNMVSLRANRKIILLVSLSSIPFVAFEFFALKWGAWFYYSERTLNFSFLAQVETYILGPIIMAFGASLTIACTEKLEKEGELFRLPILKLRNRRLPWKALRRAFVVVAATKR
ncbi:TPA: hypothetical protein DIS56_03655 [Candidatus Saccharibacteria bacterium]|nr:MAG: hypothetical protein UX30_C0007G0119 [Candidatus Saccharibacteria bacterium GW2011_GWA2_46_10]HCM52195.1 hypothetical protein [Candidatus Saccharibacteria bacterium]